MAAAPQRLRLDAQEMRPEAVSCDELRAVSFDCYGTLIDVASGRGAFLYELALREGEREPPPGGVLAAQWAEIQFALVQAGWRPYRELVAETLRKLVVARGWRWRQKDSELLVRLTRASQPYPDAQPALAALTRSGRAIAIASNTDRQIIEHTLRQLEIAFDVVVTAEDCRAYKPAPEVMQRLLERLGEPAHRVLHVAGGYRYDIPTAHALGCRTAWINRTVQPTAFAVQPDFVWRDLWSFADSRATGS